MTEDTEESGGRSIKTYAAVAVGLILLGALAVVLSPLLHSTALFLYANIWIVQLTALAGVLAYAYKRRADQKRSKEEDDSSSRSYSHSRRTSTRMRALKAFGVLLAVFLVGGLFLTGALSDHAMGQGTMAESQELNSMYEGDADHPRIVTREQANRWAAGSVRSSKYNPTDNAIVVYENTTYWGSNLVPTSSTRNYLTEQQNGTVLVNAESFEKNVTVIEGEMQVGRGMGITDSVYWRLKSVTSPGPWMVNYHLDAQRTIIQGGGQYLAVPYTQPKHYLLPLTYSHPSEGGVALIHADGNIEHLSLAEARENDVLAGQPLLPPKYVRHKIAATTYRAGITDTLPVFGSLSETINVAPVPGENNEQPFYMRTADHGGQYVVAVEPTGGTQGLREMWFVDVRTGEFARYESNQSNTLYGPSKSSDFVIDANDRTDWNKFAPSEPIPTVVDGDLYWQFRVVQEGGGGITFISLVNANSQEVTNIDDSEGAAALSAFMRGENVGNTTTVGEVPEGDREPTMIVQKRNAEGEVVETMYVYGNETVVTKPYDGEGNTTASGE